MGAPLRNLEFDPDRDIWERHKGQNLDQYNALRAYLALPTPRTIQDLPRFAENSPDFRAIKYGVDYLYKLRTHHRWNEIAEAYDANQHQRYMQRMAAEQRRAAEQRLQLSRGMMTLVVKALAEHINPTDVTAATAAQLATVIDRIQRGVFELHQATRIEVTGSGGGPVELADWDALPHAEQAARLADIAAEKSRQAELLAAYIAPPEAGDES